MDGFLLVSPQVLLLNANSLTLIPTVPISDDFHYTMFYLLKYIDYFLREAVDVVYTAI